MIDKRETAAILTGLRLLQHQYKGVNKVNDNENNPFHIILTDEGMVEPLSETEIDILCERLNMNTFFQMDGLLQHLHPKTVARMRFDVSHGNHEEHPDLDAIDRELYQWQRGPNEFWTQYDWDIYFNEMSKLNRGES